MDSNRKKLDRDGFEVIYKERGEFQSNILAKVRDAATFLKDRGFFRVLDLGCGTGRHSLYLAEQGFSVHAVDISQTSLEIAREKAALSKLHNITFAQGDMMNLQEESSSFDAVLCVWSMGHGYKSDVQQAIDEIFRVLRPDGVVFSDFMSIEDETFGKGQEIEKNTFIGSMKGEEHIPHHYSTREDLAVMFSRYRDVSIDPVDFSYKDGEKEHVIKAFNVTAVRPML